jgi:MoxR-like ATPase
VEGALEGKQEAVELALVALLARGHLLIEDVPGVGKTTLARAHARSVGGELRRVQFTSDLLPSDVVGVSVFNQRTAEFELRQGPVFANVLLADEINRASPRTQSALLEAMNEQQVSIDGQTIPLPDPFFVIATQNPTSQVGTFPLPESQLDRFLMCIELGYPNPRAERALLAGRDRRELIETMEPVLEAGVLREMQAAVTEVHVGDALLDYVQALLAYTRESAEFALGLSPRAGLGVVRAAQAYAFTDDRAHVLPEDVQAVLPPVVGHRLQPLAGEGLGHARGGAAAERLLRAVPIP